MTSRLVAAIVAVISGLAAFSAVASGDSPSENGRLPIEAALAVAGPLDPGQKAAGRLTLTNPQGTAATCRISYSLQTDGTMYSVAPPDPVFGSDCALGARSWTVAEGKTIEEGSLTDGKDYTDAGTDYGNDRYTEAFQFVDLGEGKVRKISRIGYLSGDANHAWKMDVAVSRDGQTYSDVPGLLGIDMYKKWGEIVLPLTEPAEARFVRLRYHNDGKKVPVLRMPCRLSVYDGVAGESFELPKVGEVVASGTKDVEVGAKASAEVELSSDRALTPGMYLLAARVECGEMRRLAYHHVLVLPDPLKAVSAESRFGINAANGDWASIVRRLGVGWVRFENMKWPFVSPEAGVYRFDGSVKPWQVNHDAIFKGYADQGLNVLPFLFMIADHASGAPANAKEGRRSFYPPKDNASFGEFAYQVAARYGGKQHPAPDLKTADGKSGLGYLHVYEIWNEPNLTNPDWGAWIGTVPQFMELFRAAAEAVRRADPAAKVTNAGYAGIQVKTVDQLRTHKYADGKCPLDFVDILNVHFYSGRVAPEISQDDFNAHQTSDLTVEQEFRRLLAWRDKNKPGMPIWLTETGYDSAGPFGTDERTQAARLPRVVMLALASGIDKVFVYRESGSTASMHAASGLLRDDGTYKPSYLTYATLIRELDGVMGPAIRVPHPDKNVRMYLWRRGDDRLLTAWTIEGEAKLDLKLGKATVTDAFGQRRAQDLSAGLTLSAFPVYIRDFADAKVLQALELRAQQEEVDRQARREKLAKAEAYLFKFGGGAEAVTLEVGRERSYTPVSGSDVFSEQKGYGFSPGQAVKVEERAWISSELDRAVCRLDKGREFQFKVKPGHYRLRFGVSPFEDAAIMLKGCVGGDQSLPATKGDTVVEASFEAGGAVLSVSTKEYALFRWLTVIEQVPGAV